MLLTLLLCELVGIERSTRELVFVYLTNHLLTLPAGVGAHGELSDLALGACL